jgi:ketosteroid isomerase-like protein
MTDPTTLARSYLRMWNSGDLAAVDAVLAADVVGHRAGATLHGRETFKERVAALHATYRALRWTEEDILVQGDRSLLRWSFTGTHENGRTVHVTGMNLFRIADDRIVELWVETDDLGELRQLGVVS